VGGAGGEEELVQGSERHRQQQAVALVRMISTRSADLGRGHMVVSGQHGAGEPLQRRPPPLHCPNQQVFLFCKKNTTGSETVCLQYPTNY